MFGCCFFELVDHLFVLLSTRLVHVLCMDFLLLLCMNKRKPQQGCVMDLEQAEHGGRAGRAQRREAGCTRGKEGRRHAGRRHGGDQYADLVV